MNKQGPRNSKTSFTQINEKMFEKLIYSKPIFI